MFRWLVRLARLICVSVMRACVLLLSLSLSLCKAGIHCRVVEKQVAPGGRQVVAIFQRGNSFPTPPPLMLIERPARKVAPFEGCSRIRWLTTKALNAPRQSLLISVVAACWAPSWRASLFWRNQVDRLICIVSLQTCFPLPLSLLLFFGVESERQLRADNHLASEGRLSGRR